MDKNIIKPNNIYIFGFDNVGRKPLRTIKLPIKVVPCFHILVSMSFWILSYNLLLGRLWIHAMKGVLYTLHQEMKYEYNNKIYVVKADEKVYTLWIEVEHNTSKSFNTLIKSSKFEPLPSNDNDTMNELLGGDWGD